MAKTWTIHKREETKEDGRRIIYYTFPERKKDKAKRTKRKTGTGEWERGAMGERLRKGEKEDAK